jgi:hypothetical protein
MSTSARFSGLSLPTERMTGRSAGSPYRDRSDRSAGPGENRSRSTPLDTACDGTRSPRPRSSRSAVAVGAVTRSHPFANRVTSV